MAHCNFQLRGRDSDHDESFVRELAAYLEMPFLVKHFDVDTEVQSRGISVQMAARELRYLWFEELLAEKSLDLHPQTIGQQVRVSGEQHSDSAA